MSTRDVYVDGRLAGSIATPPEVDNADTLRTQLATALATNRAYVGLASPSAAQTTAQVKALSRQVNALIRLAIAQLDGTD